MRERERERERGEEEEEKEEIVPEKFSLSFICFLI
jgi:hypothetical protein